MSSKIDWKAGDVAIIRPEWHQAGFELNVLGPAVFSGQWWVPVVDPDDENPTFYKEACLEKKE